MAKSGGDNSWGFGNALGSAIDAVGPQRGPQQRALVIAEQWRGEIASQHPVNEQQSNSGKLNEDIHMGICPTKLCGTRGLLRLWRAVEMGG